MVFAASGGTLYGEPAAEDLPVRESHPQQPLSPYGVSKKAVIDYLVAYRELHSLEFCALALGNVYGPRQNPHGEAGVVAIFADRILRGRAGDRSSETASRPGTSSSSTTSSTPSCGRPPAVAASSATSGPARETSVNELLATMAAPVRASR